VEDRIETDELAELIGKKLVVLEQLRGLSRRQSDLIADGDIQRLLGVLSAKQTLLVELQKLQKLLEPFRKQEPDARRWRTPHDRQRCRQAAERCETLLSEIMLIDRQSEAEMTRRRDAVQARLEECHSCAEATRAYLRPAAALRGNIDLTSDT